MTDEDVLAQAEILLKNGDVAGAERKLSSRWSDIKRAPGDAMHMMAEVRDRQRRAPEAVQLLRDAARAEPQSQRHFIALGHALTKQGDDAGAADAYAQAAKINPDWPGVYLVLSRALYHANRAPEAEQAGRMAVQKQPSADTYDALANAFLLQGKGADALAAAEQALKADPNHFAALHTKGGALAQVGRHQDALKAFDDLIAKGVQAPPLWVNRAAALQALGRKDEANAVFDDAARRWPDLPNLKAQIAARRK